ncbi:MAG: ABC transporter ATP-binding protein [Acidobacteria bacterium]|nr:ABC transporter ATP-binding protein [Acidobacteriota bacterium]
MLAFDEPTSALDVGHACATMDLLARSARAGRAVLFTLHDLTLALRGTTRAALMVDGVIVADGEPAAVLTGDAARDAFRIPLARVGPPDAIVPAR